MMHYTYVHYRASDGLPFYVGKGKGRRAWSHQNRNQHWKNTCSKHGIKVQIAAEWKTESEAFEHEKFLILCFKDMGVCLVNQTNGGEGASGLKWSEESKKRVHSHKRHASEIAKKKISETTKAAMARPEVFAKLGLHSIGKKASVETREKMSASHKKLLNESRIELLRKQAVEGITPEIRARITKAITGLKREKIACPHCAKEGAANVMYRWHFDNCKSKESV
jgi:hypothetical protein